MTRTAQQLRNRRRLYDRLYKAGPASGIRVHDARIVVPANVERTPVSEPCFMCGTARGLCRHRRIVREGAGDLLLPAGWRE